MLGNDGDQFDKKDKSKDKKGLKIEIDENANIAEQDNRAQQMLLENVMKNENKMAAGNGQQSMAPGAQQMPQDEEEEHYTEESIIQ